jgi:hypothetical protein
VVIAAACLIRAAGRARPGLARPPVTRRAGEQLASTELYKPIYHHPVPWILRLVRWITRGLNAAGLAVPGGWWALIALAALIVVVATFAVAWIGPVALSRKRAPGPIRSEAGLSARDHRQNAERLAAAGDFTTAIIESVRAIAVGLEEKGILPPRPGRTADELAAEAGGMLPALAGSLTGAAGLFDDVRYGDRAGTAEGYARLRDLDTTIRAARPAVSAATRAATVATPDRGALGGPG